MIVIGYQGIGKSTLCYNDNNNILRYLDLESSSFFDDNGKRPDDWYIYYCNVAEHLSRQKFIVFVSSHEVVRNRLFKSSENVVCVFPSEKLKDEWIKRLEFRYQTTKLEKDYKAWQNSLDNYDNNIADLKKSGFPCIEISSMDYSLKDLIVDYEIYLLSHKIKENK